MEGAHPAILKCLGGINFDKNSGYGLDCYCESASKKIKEACKLDNADIFFVAGGTQANALVIDGTLNSCDGVLAADTGHIAVHEAGAVEAWGHKVIALPHKDGKILAESAENYLKDFYSDESHDHMVAPGMMYISNPTEYGTLYSMQELESLNRVCKEYNIPLFIDGARLGYGLMADDYDVTLEKLAHVCDIFYIGGTKVGAFFGEAIVVANPDIFSKRRVTLVKRHGALLAKGWLLGLQFDALFTDNLYLKISKNAIDMAGKMKKILADKGYQFAFSSPTNQQFIIVENSQLERMKGKIGFTFWEKKDDSRSVIRFVTSWATTDLQLEELNNELEPAEY